MSLDIFAMFFICHSRLINSVCVADVVIMLLLEVRMVLVEFGMYQYFRKLMAQ